MFQGLEYSDFEKALTTLGVVSKTDKKTLHKLYLSLSKEFHPDAPNGDTVKFQAINDAYQLVKTYMENYRFDFDEVEFKKQYPFSKSDWLSGR
ncbi:DnaJ domain-containing protein [Sulfurospirillum diekertiae]|uniref:Chaperone protein DnaJ n=1 Tax=Sulfurospirillum diekertiae TaxID=1854492 RepID=A0A1Y0HNP2_9BACT|nr:DnaJ domain-containing protein [Sulfurospirillum diekertiae]ARU48833.1 Chaperone protein DnaJ [Sulfurospirillum diekertiae]ASC93654.1 Chaperone protein DnaJ [Sulfurospirillum diekertiae]